MSIQKLTLGSILLLAITAMGCGQTTFSARKDAVLAKNSVLSSDGESGSDRDINRPDQANGDASKRQQDDYSSGNSYGELILAGDMTQPPYLGYPGNGSIPVNRVCSYGRSMSNTNYLRAVAQGKPVELRVNGKTCSTNAAAIRAVVMSANVTKAQLAALCPSAMPTSGRIEPTLKINGAVALGGNSLDFEILYANNADVNIGGANGVGENGGTGYVAIAAEYDQANCTTTASPLVVRMPGAGGSKISLTSIAKGIFFDLLGRMNGHRKVRIGWFTNDDFALVALPNKNGEVRGIDELFGDHTTGPDGKISENGYAALAKYDDNRDGKIDRADRVFSELRLLLPVSGAIRSLEDTGVAFIDLDYSRDYFEVDQHGNETRMKSVVGYSDGSLDLIFDLWFRYQK